MQQLKKLLFGLEGLPDQLLWFQRRETWAGDVKANFIRVVALIIFAVNEILNYHVFHVVDKKFHTGSMAVVLLWLLASVVFHALLRRHSLPRITPYLIPSVDILLLTWLLFLADGTRSPLVSVYFLIIALAGLRFNPLVILYTAGATVIGYLGVVQFTKVQKPEFLVPVYHVVIVSLALLLMGVIVSHLLARVFVLLNQATGGKHE